MQKSVKQVQKQYRTTPHQKSAVAVFFCILEKHAVSAIRYLQRFQYLRAGWDNCKIEMPQVWRDKGYIKTEHLRLGLIL